jgi:hypothetical protein
MTYEKAKNSVYRMPTHFGPSPGPRQTEDGSPRGGSEFSPHTYSTAVTFRGDADQIQALLPPRFELMAPNVTVLSNYLKELDWLAGRGYNVISVVVLSPSTVAKKRLLRTSIW